MLARPCLLYNILHEYILLNVTVSCITIQIRTVLFIYTFCSNKLSQFKDPETTDNNFSTKHLIKKNNKKLKLKFLTGCAKYNEMF